MKNKNTSNKAPTKNQKQAVNTQTSMSKAKTAKTKKKLPDDTPC